MRVTRPGSATSRACCPPRVPPIWLMPQHILEKPLQENKAGFFSLDYWREGFVGAGPYKMVDWVAGSHALLGAYEGYVLGRPKIERLQVRFIPDNNTVLANLLADEVHIAVDFSVLTLQERAELYIPVFLGTFSGVVWGLLVSAVAATEERAMLLIIAVVIPQFLLAGGTIDLSVRSAQAMAMFAEGLCPPTTTGCQFF